MYLRLFAGEGLCAFVFASSRMPDSALANRHGCSQRPSLKLISHFEGGGGSLSAAAADKNTASRALVILKSSNGEKESSIGEYQQCLDYHSISQSLCAHFWLARPE